MKTYRFPSKSSATVHQTTVYDNGAVQCSCIAGKHGKPCWHLKAAEDMARREPVISLISREAIRELIAEGNDAGALELTRDIFPSMSVEETQELLEQILLDELPDA